MAPDTLDTVEASALTGVFGAAIGFAKFELLRECHFVKYCRKIPAAAAQGARHLGTTAVALRGAAAAGAGEGDG